MEILLSIGLGIGLAAACGFRVFLPVLAMGVAARAGALDLAEGFEWMAGTPALLALGAAAILEVGAYYIPWLDNVLDVAAMPRRTSRRRRRCLAGFWRRWRVGRRRQWCRPGRRF